MIIVGDYCDAHRDGDWVRSSMCVVVAVEDWAVCSVVGGGRDDRRRLVCGPTYAIRPISKVPDGNKRSGTRVRRGAWNDSHV